MGDETGMIEKKDVWEELAKNFKGKQLETLKFLADYVEQLEGVFGDYALNEDTKIALRNHRHLDDGMVVEPI